MGALELRAAANMFDQEGAQHLPLYPFLVESDETAPAFLAYKPR